MSSPARLPESARLRERGAASHLLATDREGTRAVALAPLLPCQWSYGEIGQRLTSGGVPHDPVYADWIAMFSGHGYDVFVRASPGLPDSCAVFFNDTATT